MPRPQFPPIAPLEDQGQPRPFWSVMIPAYNRIEYLDRTLRSVLEQVDQSRQPYGTAQMQIEVVDNASTEPAVEALVQRVDEEFGGGRVGFFQQERNVGLVGNWNTCVERARGQWVHILHDDDMVLPGFYDQYEKFIREHPEVGLVLSRPILINEDDTWQDITRTPSSLQETKVWEDALFGLATEDTSHFLRCPTIVVRREAYEQAGGFDLSVVYSIDWQMWIRVAARFAVGYIHQPLVLYRQHTRSVTFSLVHERDLLADLEHTIAIALALLPPERRPQARRAANAVGARLAEMYRWYVRGLGQHRAELRYSRHLFHYAPSPRALLLVFKSWARALLSQALGHRPPRSPSSPSA